MKKTYGVLGGGSWGTAIVKILLEKSTSINWYVRSEENIDFIKKHKRNPNYLRSLVLNLSLIHI